ncbi:probable sarcosine oxidase [Cicer arietinum]|uniref:Probable sarcosine oxidase n=1 Tax=Cicer arietinum TaxID=3827 RepID=A0A1S2YAI4_CICAR|nr:probable sarcosine oxidase [Cicer arietinum]
MCVITGVYHRKTNTRSQKIPPFLYTQILLLLLNTLSSPSFTHTHSNSLLKRSIQSMENSIQFDLIVVGAGVMGSSTAYYAAKHGLKTLLLEQFDFLHHRGSSHGESRTIRATYLQPHYYPLVLQSYKLWLEAQAQVGYNVYFKAPHLDMAHFNDPTILAVIENCRKHGAQHHLLNHMQVAQKFSGNFNIPEDWVGLSTEHGGVIKPSKAVAMFQTLAYKNGAVLKDNAEVTDIKNDGGVVVLTASGEKFHGKKCVVTVGAWVNKLVKKINGVELPILPVECHVTYWRITEGHEGKFAIGNDFPTFASFGSVYVYGTPTLEYPGLIKVAVHGGNPCDPDKRPWGPLVMMNELKEWVEGRFSGLVDSSEPVVKQSCMYSMTPDEDFVIDFLGGEFGKNVVLGGGFSGHGFKMAPVIGKILTQLVVDGETNEVDLKHFRIGRFNLTSKI